MSITSMIIIGLFALSFYKRKTFTAAICFFELVFASLFLSMFDGSTPVFFWYFLAGSNTAAFVLIGACIGCNKRVLLAMFLSVLFNYAMVFESYFVYNSLISSLYMPIIMLICIYQLIELNTTGGNGFIDRLSNSLHDRVFARRWNSIAFYGVKK